MTKIIRAGYIADAKTYANGILTAEVNGDLELARYVASYVDGLRKGWHIASVTETEDGAIRLDVAKKD